MGIYYAIILLLLPIIMFGCGHTWKRTGPKKINSMFGYRTARSMMNMESWHFAHRYIGALWRRCSVWLAALDVVFVLFFSRQNVNVMGIAALVAVGLQMAVLLGTIPITERALKQNFDEYGRRTTDAEGKPL